MRKVKKAIVVSLFLHCMMPSSAEAVSDWTSGFIVGACTIVAVETAMIATPIVMYFRESDLTSDYKSKSLDAKILQESESVLKEQSRKKIEDLVEEKREHEDQNLHDLVILSS